MMQPFMLHSVRCHGVQYLLGLFTQHTSVIRVRHAFTTQHFHSNFQSICFQPFLKFIFITLAIISDMLSCRLFLITTRIAYAVYLTQFPIFFYNVGTNRHSGYFHFVTTTVIVFSNWLPIVIKKFNESFLPFKKCRATYMKYYVSLVHQSF